MCVNYSVYGICKNTENALTATEMTEMSGGERDKCPIFTIGTEQYVYIICRYDNGSQLNSL